MPIVSLLENSKPFVFTPSSHSNGTSTELASPSTKASVPRSIHHSSTTHSKSSAAPLERDSYYSSSLPGSEYNNNNNNNGSSNISLIDSPSQQSTSGIRLHSHFQNQQASQHDVYKYPTTKTTHEFNDIAHSSSTSNTLHSRLPSLKPSADIPSTPPPQLHSSFPLQISTSHSKDTSYPSLTNHVSPSSRHQNGLAYDHSRVKTEGIDMSAPLLSNSHITSTTFPQPQPQPQPIITGTTTTLSPLNTIDMSSVDHGNPTFTAGNSAGRPMIGQINDGESGYFDGSSTENRRVKRRKELSYRIDGLDNDFSENKERIFAEKLLVVQSEVSQAQRNTHIQYKENLVLLETKRQKMIEGGRLFRNYQAQVTDSQFASEIHRAQEDYLAEQQEVREKLFAILEEKRRKLKDDKDNCDLCYDVPLETQTRMNKRNLRKRGTDNGDGKLNKRKQMSGPALVFRLKDKEVYDDLQAMRNGSVAPIKKSSATKKK